LRVEQGDVRGGFDLVLVPRPTSREVPFAALRETVRGLLEQAGAMLAIAEDV
jgi:RNase P protein component